MAVRKSFLLVSLANRSFTTCFRLPNPLILPSNHVLTNRDVILNHKDTCHPMLGQYHSSNHSIFAVSQSPKPNLSKFSQIASSVSPLCDHVRQAVHFSSNLKCSSGIVRRNWTGHSHFVARLVYTSSHQRKNGFSGNTSPPEWMSQQESQPAPNQEVQENSAWLVRLANENSYLSWCRNVYIASIVGATINMQACVPFAKDVAFVFFFMGGLNLVTGTFFYVTNLLKLRKRILMSTLTVSLNILLAIVHMGLWLAGIGIYIAYVEDVEPSEERNIIIKSNDI